MERNRQILTEVFPVFTCFSHSDFGSNSFICFRLTFCPRRQHVCAEYILWCVEQLLFALRSGKTDFAFWTLIFCSLCSQVWPLCLYHFIYVCEVWRLLKNECQPSNVFLLFVWVMAVSVCQLSIGFIVSLLCQWGGYGCMGTDFRSNPTHGLNKELPLLPHSFQMCVSVWL